MVEFPRTGLRGLAGLKWQFLSFLALLVLATAERIPAIYQAAYEPVDTLSVLYGDASVAHQHDTGDFPQVPLTDELQHEMNVLNRCGKGHACDQKRLDFLFRLAGKKLVKKVVEKKLNDKIPELPPITPPPPTPPPPSPPPTGMLSTCLGSPCGAIVDGSIKLGRCGVGVGGATVVCRRYGYNPFPEGSNPVGCSRYSESYCHCCDTESPTPIPPPEPVPPPNPVPPPPSPTPPVPPPVFPPEPPEGRCGSTLGSVCVTSVDGQPVFGTCFTNQFPGDENAEIATCASVGGVPALIQRGCGSGSGCICCVDAASLCDGDPQGTCGGYCGCILTYNGANCNNPIYQNPPYPGYDPPPTVGGGCQENLCNALASQNGYPGGAACCPFCPA